MIGAACLVVGCDDEQAGHDGPSGGAGEGGAAGAGGQLAESSSIATTTATSTGTGGAPSGPCGREFECCHTPWTQEKVCADADPGCADVSNYAENGEGTKPDSSQTGCTGGTVCSKEDDDSVTGWYCDMPYGVDPSHWAPDCGADGGCDPGHYCAYNFGGVCLKSCNAPKCPEGKTLATHFEGVEPIQECVTTCE